MSGVFRIDASASKVPEAVMVQFTPASVRRPNSAFQHSVNTSGLLGREGKMVGLLPLGQWLGWRWVLPATKASMASPIGHILPAAKAIGHAG